MDSASTGETVPNENRAVSGLCDCGGPIPHSPRTPQFCRLPESYGPFVDAKPPWHFVQSAVESDQKYDPHGSTYVDRDVLLAMCEALEDPGEVARKWVGEHFHQIKGAIADALNGASVEGVKIPPERSQQLATLVMASMSHVYPEAPWAGEIRDAIKSFGAEL